MRLIWRLLLVVASTSSLSARAEPTFSDRILPGGAVGVGATGASDLGLGMDLGTRSSISLAGSDGSSTVSLTAEQFATCEEVMIDIIADIGPTCF